MKTMLLSAVLAAALPSAVLASPTLLTDHEMAQIAAGSTVSLLLADGGVVNVAVNGNSWLSNFDIFATAGGQNKALVEQTTATANSSGQIVVLFTQGTADNPEVAGVEVLH